MRDELIEHYKILLAIGWLYAEDDGLISVLSGGDLMPATINGKRWILPTREQMKNTNWEHRIGFHPVRESYNLGVSDILGGLRDQWQARLHASIAHFMRQLLSIANDQKNQKNLTPDQSQVLNALPKVTANTVATFASLLKNTVSRGDADQFIKIMIRRGGTVNGKIYGRAGLVKFPIYESLIASKDAPVNGVTMTNKDRTMLISLFEFIFPSLKGNPEAFNVGIDSRSAPFMESLTRCAFKVIKELQKSAAPYLSIIDLPDLLEFPSNMDFWLDAFDSKDMIETMARTIPNMSEFDADSPPTEVSAPAPVRESRSAPEVKEAPRLEATIVVEESKPRGRLIMGSPAGTQVSFMGKASPDQKDSTPAMGRAVSTGRGVVRAGDADREAEKRRREEEDRERRERDRQEEEDRKRDRERREREREEDDRRDRERDRDRGGRDSRDDRDRDDRYERDRPRRDSRDSRDERRSTGDVFEDNPALRSQLRDVEDRYDPRDRGRGRDDRYRDPRDTRGGRDSRDRDYYDDDRDDRSRGRDRYRRR